MIKQAAIGLNSREEANQFNKDGFLPLITAPMYSVVNESNYQMFLDNKIQVCLPRNSGKTRNNFDTSYPTFISLSLNDFIEQYVNNSNAIEGFTKKICIDTANGNMPALHDAIRKAKEIHGSNLIIMAGNVASAEAFVELAKTGVDYIRVGIGGGGGCNTTSNTGVGQEDLEELIKYCKLEIRDSNSQMHIRKRNRNQYLSIPDVEYYDNYYKNHLNIAKVKIVADGISSYIKQCEIKHGFNDNGYAAINKLLFAGADLVMVGKLFAQCLESAGEKGSFTNDNDWLISNDKDHQEILFKDKDCLFVKYAGMSTHQEQKKYKKPNVKVGDVFYLKNDTLKSVPIKCTMIEHGFHWGIVQNCSNCKEVGYSWNTIQNFNKPSEGSVQWIPVRFLLKEWIWGNESQDTYPYLMGWINSIKSAMSYAGKTKLY